MSWVGGVIDIDLNPVTGKTFILESLAYGYLVRGLNVAYVAVDDDVLKCIRDYRFTGPLNKLNGKPVALERIKFFTAKQFNKYSWDMKYSCLLLDEFQIYEHLINDRLKEYIQRLKECMFPCHIFRTKTIYPQYKSIPNKDTGTPITHPSQLDNSFNI